jgi:hypothetical protein
MFNPPELLHVNPPPYELYVDELKTAGLPTTRCKAPKICQGANAKLVYLETADSITAHIELLVLIDQHGPGDQKKRALQGHGACA